MSLGVPHSVGLGWAESGLEDVGGWFLGGLGEVP